MLWLWLTSLHYTHTFYSANLYVLNRFAEALRDSFKLGGNFLHYPPTLRWAKLLTLNMFSKVPRGQIKKVMNFALWFYIYWYGLLTLFLHAVWSIEVL